LKYICNKFQHLLRACKRSAQPRKNFKKPTIIYMSIKLKITAFLIGLTFILNAQKSKHLAWSNQYDNLKEHLEEVNRKDKDSTYIETATPIYPDEKHKNNSNLHFPYPVIFVHGLTGTADTWIEFYNYALNQNWSYGGHLRFNLNSDNNFYYSNIYSNQSDVLDFNSNLDVADFYLINFNCATDGTSFGNNVSEITQSNQAAIAKQGLAIKQAVFHVLQATGRDKVILFGHSMGGLASREYLQNTDLWQQDGHHHVAKLITSGTPHGGSNATGTFFLDTFLDVDESSDAVRDLRRSYFYSGDNGVFLHGGIEDEDVLDDSIWGFYNLDVNCNGQSGNSVIGLNQKDIYADLDYSLIIGDWLYDISINDPGDGVVEVEDAQLKNFYQITAETFTILSNDLINYGEKTLHTALPSYTGYNFYALDEPDYYGLSYRIDINENYNGFITVQANDAEYSMDYDDYIFTTPDEGALTLNVENMPVNFGVSIIDTQSFGIWYNEVFQSASVTTEQIELPKGEFYLEFYANGNNTSWQYPYGFRIDWSPNNTTPISNIFQETIGVSVYPNPVSKNLIIDDKSENIDYLILELFDELGRVIWGKTTNSNKTILNMERYPSGVYLLKIRNENFSKTKRIIKN